MNGIEESNGQTPKTPPGRKATPAEIEGIIKRLNAGMPE
jgi:hypothetical protein